METDFAPIDFGTSPDASFPIETLMVIEDNSVDQMICRRIIKRSGMVRKLYPFVYANDALDFLKTKDRPVIDAILLDINMPRMDGFEFLEAATRQLGDNFARMVVVMLTTSLDPRDAKRAENFSVVREYFNKPLVLEHLERISAHLRAMA